MEGITDTQWPFSAKRATCAFASRAPGVLALRALSAAVLKNPAARGRSPFRSCASPSATRHCVSPCASAPRENHDSARASSGPSGAPSPSAAKHAPSRKNAGG